MAQAFEYALGQALGEYVCPMTHKAMWRRDAIENIHRILDRYPRIPAFAFRSAYVDQDIHEEVSDFREMPAYAFGSAWDGSDPLVHDSRKLYLSIVDLFGKHGYHGPHAIEHFKAPFACHAVYSQSLMSRVRDRFGTWVAGKFAGDSRLGYRVMDLERDVYQFPGFEPRTSSMARKTGAAGSQLKSWRYLRDVFATLTPETKQIMSRSPFGYLPLWATMTYWEHFSVVDEARDHLRVEIAFDADCAVAILRDEIAALIDIEEKQRDALLRHVEAIAYRLRGRPLRKWF